MPSCESLKSSEKPNKLLSGSRRDREIEIQYHCSRCANPLKLDNNLLAQGCSVCGAKTFRFTNPGKDEDTTSPSTHEQEFTDESLDVIRLVQPGVYQINLSKLSGMDSSSEPLVLSAKHGIFRIAFPTKNES